MLIPFFSYINTFGIFTCQINNRRCNKTIVKNKIFRTTPGSEGSGPEGQLGIDMSPAQPHTIGRARTCESCHLSEKALGYGIVGGRLHRGGQQRG